MNEINLSEAIQVKSFGFNVPCREFVISAQITRDRRMPMVDEYVLRVLNVCESITSSRLMRFFGFSTNEMQIVLADLQNRSLVTITDNNISLHSSAKEIFRTSGDNPPTITTVESFPARIWFELISQSMIASKGRHNVKHLIPLKPIPARMDIGESFAREAFSLNFQDYLRQFRNIKDVDQWSLYAIVDVQPSRFSYAQIVGKQDLFIGTQPKLETTLLPTDSDRPSRLRLLTDAMASALDTLDDPEPTNTSRLEWSRLVRSDSIELCTTKEGYVDVRKWLEIYAKTNNAEQHAFIGYPYLERNRQALASLLGEIDVKARTNLHSYSLYWFRPGGNSWGLSEDINQVLSDLRNIVRRQFTSGLFTTLIAPASVNAKNARGFDRIFDRGFHAKAGRMSPALEVVIIPDLCALVSVNVPLSSSVNVPIGIMTINPNDIKRLFERLKPEEPAPELNKLWSKDREKKLTRPLQGKQV